MEKLITIIIAVYNIEDYLERCVDSVLGQTWVRLEVILVDDGSTDSSGRICDAYAEKDRRIKVIHKENGGLSDARNAGLRIAAGDYIGFVDGDDWIGKDMYRAMYEACESGKAQAAVCRYRQVRVSERTESKDEGQGQCIVDGTTGNSVFLTREQALEIYVCGDDKIIIYNSVWSKLFSHDLIRGMRFPVGKKSEDIMFTTKAFCKMERCAYLDTPYYNYVLDREGSIMNEKAGERRLSDEIPFWREQISYFASVGMPELADKAAYHFYRRMLFYYIDFMENPQTRGYAKRITGQLRGERSSVRRIYRKSYVKRGDRVRMRLALLWPWGYYGAVRLYDKYVIPLRSESPAGNGTPSKSGTRTSGKDRTKR